jgi:hypothetical protein
METRLPGAIADNRPNVVMLDHGLPNDPRVEQLQSSPTSAGLVTPPQTRSRSAGAAEALIRRDPQD